MSIKRNIKVLFLIQFMIILMQFLSSYNSTSKVFEITVTGYFYIITLKSVDHFLFYIMSNVIYIVIILYSLSVINKLIDLEFMNVMYRVKDRVYWFRIKQRKVYSFLLINLTIFVLIPLIIAALFTKDYDFFIKVENILNLLQVLFLLSLNGIMVLNTYILFMLLVDDKIAKLFTILLSIITIIVIFHITSSQIDNAVLVPSLFLELTVVKRIIIYTILIVFNLLLSKLNQIIFKKIDIY